MRDIVCVRDRSGLALVGGCDHDIYRNYPPDRLPDDFKPEWEVTFEWGYAGEGPREFAANILYHATNGGYDFALQHHVDFTNEVVATIPRSGGIIRAEHIRAWIAARAPEDEGADSA